MARTAGSHAETTGPRIQAAALRLFAHLGYAAVSMRQIAAEVGVQAGALYNYTADKQSLLMSLMELHMQDVLDARQAARSEGTPLARLESFVKFHIGFHLARPDALLVSYMELRNLEPENFAKIEALRRDYENELERILSDGTAQGIFSLDDPKIATLAIISMLNGVVHWFRPDGRLEQVDIEEIYWGMVRRAVGATDWSDGSVCCLDKGAIA
ncbi:MAG: TetR/AcrR family transcriptional regulator [Rhodobacteraceae bacterium]|nr:TetR/AcrR family transcriptional regulator [Paracoccaceae bacterium]